MNTIAIDTSTHVLGMAVIQDEHILAKAKISGQFQHSKNILPLFETMMTESGLSLKQIEIIAVGVGPGSFTGLRVGHAFVKGLCAVDNIPVYPFSSMELLAWNIKKEHDKIAVILDARRDKFYFGFYRKSDDKIIMEQEPVLLSLDQVLAKITPEKNLAITGDALKRFREPITSHVEDARFIYPEEAWAISEDNFLPLLQSKKEFRQIPFWELQPHYLRFSEAEEKMKGLA